MPKYYKKTLKRYKKKVYRKKVRPSLKKQLLRMHESKEVGYQLGQSMTDNQYYVLSPTQQIVPGSSGTTRVGDEVYLQSLQLSGWFASSTAAGATQKFRCQVVWHRKETPATAFVLNGLSGTDLFHVDTFASIVNGIVNTNAVTVLADFVVDINQVLTGVNELKSFNIVVPLHTTFKYKDVGGVYGKQKNLYVVLTAYIAGGLGTANAGSFTVSSLIKYKDP